MLIPLVARTQGQSRTEIDRYAAWRQAIEQLRGDYSRGPAVKLGQLERYLNGVPVSQHPEVILDLVAVHLRLSWCAGDKPILEDYLSVIRKAGIALEGIAELPIDLIEDEFLARHTVPYGDMPSLEHYAGRFPLRGDVQQCLSRRELGAGRFLKLARLGHGASAEVWEALDRAQRTLVAIKLPCMDGDDQQLSLDAFFREAQLTSALNHPGIVNLRACDPCRPEPVFVMKLVKGSLLSDGIRSYHQPPASRTTADQQSLLEKLVNGLASACDALEYAHARGVVHCDIKPGNIAIEASGRAVVLDWGLAQRMTPNPCTLPLESTGNVCAGGESSLPFDDAALAFHRVAGTPDYMAPEQLRGEFEVRTDVFGLGATLYEILAGRAPHAWSDGVRPADWMRRVGNARFVRPRRWNPQASRKLEAICLKCLARDPQRRLPTAAALADELRQCLGNRQAASANSLFGRVWLRVR